MIAKSDEPRDAEVSPPAPEPFDAAGLAKSLLRTVRTGALATLDRETGGPFCTLVTVATDIDGSPLTLLSGLSAHTANLDRDARASLLLSGGGKGDPLAHPRLTLVGSVERTDEPRCRARFLRRHPKAQLYAEFPDFGFRRLRIGSVHLNGGFARAASLAASDLVLDLSGDAQFLDAEAGAVNHMNEDHADALALYATRLAGQPDGAWRCSGLDPEGLDLLAGDLTARITFPERVFDGGSLRRVLIALAGQARAG